MFLFRQPGFLGLDECLQVREAMNVGAPEEAEILADGIQRQRQVRRAVIIEPVSAVVDAIESRLESCRDRVAGALGANLGGREGPGFIRYPAGGFYKPHRDRGEDLQWAPAARRVVALVLFLNTSRHSGRDGDFDGGVLQLLTDGSPVMIAPEAGLLVAFAADVLHEVTPVRGGSRDTIVDWFYNA